MNRHLLLAPLVAGLGIAAVAVGLATPGMPAGGPAAPMGLGPAPVLPAARVLAPVVPGISWETDPFTMARLGERRGASLPFPPPPPVGLPTLPLMPFPEKVAP